MANTISSAVLRSIAVALITLLPLLVSAADLIQDPKVLQAKLRGTSDPRQVALFLVEQGIFQGSRDDPLPESWFEVYGRGAAYDLFRANLAGDKERETILQLRFGQQWYLLVFFELGRGGWRRIPGFVSVGGLDGDTECKPSGCPGHFCFDLVDLRVKGEAAIVGRSCEHTRGPEGGEVEELVIWQITSSGSKEAARAVVREAGAVTKGQVEHRSEYAFEGAFPKKLVLRQKGTAAAQRQQVTLPIEFSN